MNTAYRDYKKIDVYEEYRKIPGEEIQRLAEEKILPNEKLAEMWNFTFPFLHQVLNGLAVDPNLDEKAEQANVFARESGNYSTGHISSVPTLIE